MIVRFADAILEMLGVWNSIPFDDPKLYSPSISILQCSGSGKSRLVRELANWVPTIYLCHRNSKEEAFPPLTPGIIDYLCQSKDSADPDVSCFIRCAAFYYAAYEAVLAFHKLWKESGQHSIAYGSLFIDFQWKDGFWSSLITRIRALENELWNHYTSMARPDEWSPVEELFKAKMGRLGYFAPQVNAIGNLFMVVAIDETRGLDAVKWNGATNSVMAHLHRASRLMKSNSRCALLMMDTLCSLPILTSRFAQDSDRIVASGSNLKFMKDMCFWDVHASYTNSLNVGRACTFRELVKFGRPIWYPMSRVYDMSSVMSLAESKIVERKLRFENNAISLVKDLEKSSWLNDRRAAAVICSRIGLPINPFVSLAVDLIASFMGYLTRFDPERNLLEVTYPSDPILAIAANAVWQDLEIDYKTNAIGYLQKCIGESIVSKGDRGEYITALLCLEPLRMICEPKLCRVLMTVEDWLKCLFGIRGIEGVSKAKPKFDDAGVDFNWDLFLQKCCGSNMDRDSFLDGRIHLTHFVKCKTYSPNRADLLRAFQRGAGFLCKTNQFAFDLIIPVVLKRPIEELSSAPVAHKKLGNHHTQKFKSRMFSAPEYQKQLVDHGNVPFALEYWKARVAALHQKSIQQVNMEMAGRKAEDFSNTTSGGIDPNLITDDPIDEEDDFEATVSNMSYILINSKAEMSETYAANVTLPAQPLGQIEKTVDPLRPYALIAMVYADSDERAVVKQMGYSHNSMRFAYVNPHWIHGEKYGGALNELMLTSTADKQNMTEKELIYASEQCPLQYCEPEVEWMVE